MKIKSYLKDKILGIILVIMLVVLSTMMLMAFHVKVSCIIAMEIMLVIVFGIVLTYDYYKRNKFYTDFLGKLNMLDQKYLITEMIGKTEFSEAQILKDSLYEINKCMQEKINTLQKSNDEFKEYLEMWIHEIKVPLSVLTLMNYNNNTDIEKEKGLIRNIEHYVEQILFMARADIAEKDYLMKKVLLEECVNKSVVSGKEILIENHVAIEKKNLETEVVTDSKWLEFILGQLISNSAKYIQGDCPKIIFYSYKDKDKTVLVVEDNGIGIPKGDIARVFDKTFTGENGRKREKTTGMGLYICKKLCSKMGHNIRIESEQNRYTKVFIEFGKESYYMN